ncbi:RagB/SusD family nutrient uptake outer membrane protein [Chitinophaga cymbidii]|uniref:RagB/SusD family nutrient uptake outer membrane protein n=1 Tax=Chitinophaga cymbidii TaxID=1096750 RepID=UPI0011BEBA9B|nr:RagB/SusD family nutrient uptake outer membrane protein [Chitinophaga cymbidii]
METISTRVVLTLYKCVLLVIAGAALLLSGCGKSFLELKNPQAIDFDHISDLESLTTASTGVYSLFKQSNYYNRTFILVPELMTDNGFISIKNSGRYLNEDRFTVTNGDSYITGAWRLMSQVVTNANLALAASRAIEFPAADQEDANQIIGELYACRALACFDMLRFYAQPYNFTADASHPGIPIYTEPANQIIYPARETVAKSYDQIIADLKQAESLLGDIKKNGHFTLAAAQALLAKVYLYKEDWVNAELYATKAIDNGNYTLLSNGSYVSGWASKFTAESLLEIGNTPNSNSGSDGIGYFTEQNGYGDFLATEDLYNIYAATDVRRNLIVPGVRAGGEPQAYFIKKYPNGVSSRDDNPKVLRKSEVYLIRAEARAEQALTNDSHRAGALEDLNRIAQRADPLAADVDLSGEALIDRILLERRKELAFEGNRLFDLNRKGKDVTNIQSDAQTTFEYPHNRFIMPVPYDEMNANPNMDQNPGWR